MLRFDRKQQNSVKQLSFDKKKKIFKETAKHACHVLNYVSPKPYVESLIPLFMAVVVVQLLSHV